MENNADKHLREKLQGVEMPFDPAAWEQMEAMLDKKKKRRGFFWWWTGGIAAALLLTGGSYMLLQQGNTQQAPETLQQTAAHTTNTPTATGAQFTETAPGNVQGQGIAPMQNSTGANATTNAAGEPATSETTTQNNNSLQAIALNKKTFNNTTTVKNSGSQHKHTSDGKRQSTTKHNIVEEESNTNQAVVSQNSLNEVSALQQQTNSGVWPGQNTGNNGATTTVTEQPNTTTTVTANEQSPLAETNTPLTLDSTAEATAPDSLLPSDENKKADKKASHKASFSYQLGVRTDLMATMAPLVMNAYSGYDTLSRADKKGPAKFTVSAGIFNEFNFINRISVYMGVMYTRSTFQVNHPRVDESMAYSDSTYRVYQSYTAQQHQIDLPIGLKVYPYVSEKVRFSVGFGIINHIKLKETFTAHITQTPIANLSAALDVPFTYTTANPFEVKNSTADVTTGAAGNQNLEAGYFGTNAYSRYYLSVYASLGAEFILAKKYSLLVEPLYYFAGQRMGEQQRRKHSVGLSLGFKYNFGSH